MKAEKPGSESTFASLGHAATDGPRRNSTLTPVSGFRAWCRTYVGCEGGDFGSPARPSIWVSGIEPGGPYAVDARALQRIAAAGAVPLATGYADWRDNLAGSFRRRILKLLAAIAGRPVADYRAFAEEVRPFTRGSVGYARLNLYPVGFADTDPHRWTRGIAQVTGFATKGDYVAWCDAERLPVLRRWTEACRIESVKCCKSGGKKPSLRSVG